MPRKAPYAHFLTFEKIVLRHDAGSKCLQIEAQSLADGSEAFAFHSVNKSKFIQLHLFLNVTAVYNSGI